MSTRKRRTSDSFPEWYNPEFPNPEECVIGSLLDLCRDKHPRKVFARFEGDVQWTYEDVWFKVRRWAAGLQNIGISADDTVLVWLPNRPEIINAWFSINYIGAIYVPVNTAYRGDVLSHVIENSGARLLIAHHDLISRLTDIDLGQLELVISVGKPPEISLSIPIKDTGNLEGDSEKVSPSKEIMPWDTAAIIYTSGTTGPSKGVKCSYFHFYNVGTLAVGFIDPSERCFINMPLFHIGAAGGVFGSLVRHASIGIVDGFSTTEFWNQLRELDCAVMCGMVGSVVAFLSKRPPSDEDKNNPLRRVVVAPVNSQVIALAKRHDFEYFTGFGMTEAPMPLISEVGTILQGGYCGRPRDGIECRVVDENDIEVPQGNVGELIIRSDYAWSMNHGYVNNAQATVEAWKNGWFHTGDAFTCDKENRFFFVDRLKDAIRRRGENISSHEVEMEVLQFPDVLDVAAIPIPAEEDEDEVMIVVQSKLDQTIDPVVLIEFLIPRMAHFMVPRYIRFMDELPKTPTNKVQKKLLRDEGLTEDTWDREALGIVLKRVRLD
ncbi:MAG: AMP-binding protein [Halieaceae bacterium]|nr:AMP-binding protein [Halieaceae bacterium]